MATLVRDIMRKGLITCLPETPLGQVATLLTQHHIHALIVANPTGDPLGVISDFDLMAGEWLSVDKDSLATMKKLTAGDLMTSPIDSIDANADMLKAAQTMLDKHIHRLVVVDQGKPVGVISISDMVASIADQSKVRRETVGDVMSEAFLVCRSKTTVLSIARTMTDIHWRSVLVVDEKGKPQGVVSGKDFLKYVDARIDEKLIIGDVMHTTLTTIDVNASLHEAANVMIQNHLHRLVVTNKNEIDGFPVGVISSFDIVAEMARPDSVWQG